MSAIVIACVPIDVRRADPAGRAPWDPVDYMPLASRLKLAREINKLWEEFVTEMHDGPTTGSEVADKFWKFVTTRGLPT